MKKKSVMLLSLLMTAVIALTGCGANAAASGDSHEATVAEGQTNGEEDSVSGESTENPSFGGEISVGIPQDLDESLDPHLAVSAGTREVLFNIFEGLVKSDPTGELIPAVASDINVSDDGLTYTFTIRDGITFHNGQAVTAEDVKYSIDRNADASEGTPLVPAFSIIDNTEIVDDSTVAIHLTTQNSEFLSYLTLAIIPADYDGQDNMPIGTGPFKFVSRTAQENVVLEKYDGYWGEPAYLDKITLKIIPDADTIVTNLKGGSIQLFARITSAQAAELTEGYDIYKGTMNLVQALYINNDYEMFKDTKVRQAVACAIDRQMIMDMISDGDGVEVGTSMYPAFAKYHMPELTAVNAYDPEKAKALLAEAGYADGFDMTITVPSNYQPHIDTAQIIAEQLKAVGINATIDLVEWSAWLSDVYVGRNYQTTVIGVDASYLNADAMLSRFVSDAGNNFVNFKNAEYDELYKVASTSPDEKTMVDSYRRMEEILAEDAANAYIQDMANLVAVDSKLGGYEFYPIYVQDFAKLYYKA